MDPLSRIGIFIAVVKNASFAGAARHLGITSSAVSKQIQNLEFELQVKLLNRTTRNVAVTEEGAVFFERAGRALEDIREAKEHVFELKAHPRGPLKISIPSSLGDKYLGRAIAAFGRHYPEVELDVSFDDRFVDIVSEGFDVIVRIAALKDTTLVARKLASCPVSLCASPAYLKKHGTPKTPDDLRHHNVLAYSRNQGLHEWHYRAVDGRQGRVGLTGSFKSDSGQMLCSAAMEDMGIVLLPVFYAAEHLASGQLTGLLTDYETWPVRDIHAVFPPNRFVSTRLRLFIDHLAWVCKDLPWEKPTQQTP